MSAIHLVVFSLGLLLSETGLPDDTARLRELLTDRQHPREQNQAALLLIQNRTPEADAVVRQSLRQTESVEAFLAVTAAIRLYQESRYVDELLAALTSGRPAVRQAAAETLAALPDPAVLLRMQSLAEDSKVDLVTRQAALWGLGHSGRKSAAMVLLDRLSDDNHDMRRAAAEALTELTGQTYGEDLVHWRDWWQSHKDVANERWLEDRLLFQQSRALRLQGDLERARAEVVRLQQQLYSRLPAGDRLGHVQSLVDQDDAPLRACAVTWSVELLSVADALGQAALADLLLRLSHDGTIEVQRSAVLALGRVNESRAFDRVLVLLRRGPVSVRAAAARAMAQQAKGTGPEVQARQRQAVPALQKALDDPSLEVVVEAAEDLGTLGVPEAGPVLAALLRHPSEPVRQTAAQALERVADASLLDGLLELTEDPSIKVRFSLVGALGAAAGDGRALAPGQRDKLLARLESFLLKDADAGVRSRAATVLGECGSPAILPVLWGRVQSGEDSRVQEKAWAALIEVVARCANLEVLREWDRTLADAKQGPRRLQLLTDTWLRWQKREDTKASISAVTEMLVEVELEQGKWSAAVAHLHDLLSRQGGDAELERRLRWLLQAGEQALKEGNRPETLRVIQEAQAHLARNKELALEFEKLEKRATQE